MEQARTKTDLIDRLQRERAFWEALLRVVSEADMLLPGVVGDWTFKDVVAHLTGWRKRTIARIANPGQGRDPRPAEWPVDLDDLDDRSRRSGRDQRVDLPREQGSYARGRARGIAAGLAAAPGGR